MPYSKDMPGDEDQDPVLQNGERPVFVRVQKRDEVIAKIDGLMMLKERNCIEVVERVRRRPQDATK